ncbi:MAG: hypothetical protein FWG68_05980 [Defluviitaleaceae bacterium]|nr:hypothetical protein [Defluviitaleaceae bacterium]
MEKLAENNRVIFAFAEYASFGRSGDDYGDFSIEVFDNGKILRKGYLFGEKKHSSLETFEIPTYEVNAIELFLNENRKEIQNLPQDLFNGSCDGSLHYFTFGTKEVSGLNVHYNNLDELRNKNYNPYKDFDIEENAANENLVVDLCYKIAQLSKILKLQLWGWLKYAIKVKF